MPVSSLLNGRDSAVHNAYSVRRHDDRAYTSLASRAHRLPPPSSSSSSYPSSSTDRSDWDSSSSYKQSTSSSASSTLSGAPLSAAMSRSRTVPSRRTKDSFVQGSTPSLASSSSSRSRSQSRLAKRSAGSLAMSFFTHATPRPNPEILGAVDVLHRRGPSTSESIPPLPTGRSTRPHHRHVASVEMDSPPLSSSSSATSTSPPLTPKGPHSRSFENLSDFGRAGDVEEDLAARFLEMSLPASKRSPSSSFSRPSTKSKYPLSSKVLFDPHGELGDYHYDALDSTPSFGIAPAANASRTTIRKPLRTTTVVKDEELDEDVILDLSAPVVSLRQIQHESLSEIHDRRRQQQQQQQRTVAMDSWISLNAWMPAVRSSTRSHADRGMESFTCIRVPHAPEGHSYVVESFSMTSPRAGCASLSTWFDPASEDGQGSVSFFPQLSSALGAHSLEGKCTFRPTTYFSIGGAKAVSVPVPCKLLTPFDASAPSSSIIAPGLECTLTRGTAPFISTGSTSGGAIFPDDVHRIMADGEPSDFGILIPEVEESSTVYVLKLVPDSAPSLSYVRSRTLSSFSAASRQLPTSSSTRSFGSASSDSTLPFVWAITLAPAPRS